MGIDIMDVTKDKAVLRVAKLALIDFLFVLINIVRPDCLPACAFKSDPHEPDTGEKFSYCFHFGEYVTAREPCDSFLGTFFH